MSKDEFHNTHVQIESQFGKLVAFEHFTPFCRDEVEEAMKSESVTAVPPHTYVRGPNYWN
jgi:hypothetical protein